MNTFVLCFCECAKVLEDTGSDKLACDELCGMDLKTADHVHWTPRVKLCLYVIKTTTVCARTIGF